MAGSHRRDGEKTLLGFKMEKRRGRNRGNGGAGLMKGSLASEATQGKGTERGTDKAKVSRGREEKRNLNQGIIQRGIE